MAKKKVNKSQAIRDYLQAKPTAGPTEVVNELKKQGLSLTPALVSNVKAAMLNKAAGGGAKPGRKPVGRPVGSGGGGAGGESVKVADLVQAREFASKVGSVSNAQQLLKTLEKLN